jgi:uncharacterized caspase-like protein
MRRRALAMMWSAALLLAAQPSVAAEAGGRVALVIGIGAYVHAGRLANPANDARDVAAALRELGFAVTEAIDLDRRALDATLRDFAHRIAAADVALVFYAGHGLQVAGQNYLLPVDARLTSARDLDFEAVGLELILRQLETGRDGKASLVFLDACRDNPLARNLARAMGVRGDAFARGLAPVQSGAGTFIAFSTQPGNVARDGPGRNSPFAAALVAHMRRSAKGLGAMMIDVRRDVMVATGNAQVPWDHSALTAEFHFRPAAGLATGSITPAAEATRRQERTRRLDEELGHPAPARR